jgi:hypothetical protein
MKPELTQERLKEVMNYDPETGVFTRKNGDGKEAGSVYNHGYKLISVDGKRYMAHRLAWLYMTGSMPDENIDHKDCVKTNNAFKNLRETTQLQNAQNIRSASSNNTHGFLGVSFNKIIGKYFSRIHLNGKSNYLGVFNTPEEAHAAYIEAKRELHEFNTL